MNPLSEVRLADLRGEHLDRLVEGAITESLQLEYKRELPPPTAEGKKEFLRDLTAFANCEGGDLLFGVDEDENAAAKEVVGLTDEIELTVLRWQQVMSDGVDPRLSNARIHDLKLEGGRWVMLVRVPKSLDAPHMITLQGLNQFYLRNPKNRHKMTTSEVRRAVLRTADWRTRAQEWKDERVENVEAGGAPVALLDGARLYVHVVALAEESSTTLLERQAIDALKEASPNHFSGRSRLNFDGLLFASDRPPTDKYLLCFTEPRSEAVVGELSFSKGTDTVASGNQLETTILQAVESAIVGLSARSISPPYGLFTTLTRIRGVYIHEFFHDVKVRPFDRDRLDFPPIFITDERTGAWEIGKPIINRLWQAVGISASPFRNQDNGTVVR